MQLSPYLPCSCRDRRTSRPGRKRPSAPVPLGGLDKTKAAGFEGVMERKGEDNTVLGHRCNSRKTKEAWGQASQSQCRKGYCQGIGDHLSFGFFFVIGIDFL